jgi:hypothetical protein
MLQVATSLESKGMVEVSDHDERQVNEHDLRVLKSRAIV